MAPDTINIHQKILPLQQLVCEHSVDLLNGLSPSSHLSPGNLQTEISGTTIELEIVDDSFDESEEAAFREGTEAFLRKNVVHEIAIRSLVEDLIEGSADADMKNGPSKVMMETCNGDQQSMMNRNIKTEEDVVQYGLQSTGKENGLSDQADNHISDAENNGKTRIYHVGHKSLEKKNPKSFLSKPSLSKSHTSMARSKNISAALINGFEPGLIEDEEGMKTQQIFLETEEVRKKVAEFLKKRYYMNSSQNKHKQGNEDGNAKNSHGGVFAGCDDALLGTVLLGLAKQAICENRPKEALSFATQASKLYERSAQGKSFCLELSQCFHVISAIHCSLGDYEEAVSVLQHSLAHVIAVLDAEMDASMDHAVAAFAAYMQLGDTFALMLGKHEQSLSAYHAGLDIQIKALGKLDSRVGRTCRYLAEAYVMVLQFDKAAEFCQQALEIHTKECNVAASRMEEFADRKLMSLICNGKGQHEAALQHLLLARTILPSDSKDKELAAVNVSIGDTYISLRQFNEAVPIYEKALALLKRSKGENNVVVAAVYVRLAEVFLKTGKHHESKSYCQSALGIYSSLGRKHKMEIASGLTEIAIIYEALSEHEEKLSVMQKAIEMLKAASGQQGSVAAGIEAQIGVLHYIHGNYEEARILIGNAVNKLRASKHEEKVSLIGTLLCQMGLACLQLSDVEAAVELFEESKVIIEKEYGLSHPETLFIQGNLASAYHVLGTLGNSQG